MNLSGQRPALGNEITEILRPLSAQLCSSRSWMSVVRWDPIPDSFGVFQGHDFSPSGPCGSSIVSLVCASTSPSETTVFSANRMRVVDESTLDP